MAEIAWPYWFYYNVLMGMIRQPCCIRGSDWSEGVDEFSLTAAPTIVRLHVTGSYEHSRSNTSVQEQLINRDGDTRCSCHNKQIIYKHVLYNNSKKKKSFLFLRSSFPLDVGFLWGSPFSSYLPKTCW